MPSAADTVERFAEAYRANERARLAREVERAREVVARLPMLAEALRSDFGVGLLGYFGSLRSERLGDFSDVDLYVDRVRRGGYFAAVDRACSILGLSVDLIELDKASDSLRATITADGVVVDG